MSRDNGAQRAHALMTGAAEHHSAAPTGDVAARLALAIGDVAVAAESPESLARDLVTLLTRELALTSAAWFWIERTPGNATHSLRRAKRGAGAIPKSLSAALRAAAEVAAKGRHLVLRHAHLDEADTTTQQVLACPFGAPEPSAVLAVAVPIDGALSPSHHIAVLTRILPTLALAVRAVQPAPPATSASGLQPSDYLNLLSHDIRTPLHTLGGFLEMVADEMAGPLNERQAEFIGHARAGSMSLNAMIDDVLMLSRADAGQLALQRLPIEPVSLVERMLAALRPETQSRHVQVTADLPQRARTLTGDPERLAEALRRLVMFAVRRSPTYAGVRIALEETGDTLRIDITGAGAAIRKPQRDWLFAIPAATVVAHQTRDEIHLDLNVARMIIEMHGGTVEVTRSNESETVLSATLPAAS